MKLLYLFAAVALAGTITANAQQMRGTKMPPAIQAITEGYLIVKSPAEAIVSIDGQGAYLVVPSKTLHWGKISPGKHTIQAATGSQRWSTTVEIKPGQTTTVTADIKPEQEQLSTYVKTDRKQLSSAINTDKNSATKFKRRQQEQYEKELEARIKKDLLQQREDYAREQRARELKLQREAEKYKKEKAKRKKKKRKVRRPKVH
jgi:hypothetical protein